MSTKVWSGATDGNFQTATNWVGGVAPVAADDLIFNSGSVSVTAGLTGNAYALASLTVTENYTGSIGSGATPLTVTDGSTGFAVLTCAGRGAFYKFACTGTTTTVKVDTTPATTVYLGSGTFTNVTHSGGGGECRAESAVVTNYYGTSNAIKLYADAATAFTILQTAGYVYTSRNIATYTGKGGARLVTNSSAAITTSATLVRGDVFEHNSDGTITLVDIGPGASFPLARASKNFTITNATLWQGGYLNQNPASITVTYSNAVVYRGFGFSMGTGGGMGM